ncbi:hypothetical protein AUEXF2481DRAFT_1667 [Aureobasidium subglaciale EXF-2481]|uniref:Uncharacterized protein n=1 Tax=Aureobasidium subglaciale (strain EXF-2481) TaxID=1043005 RepID=A0A074YMB9_AURSE|nr:uncharacterized protein AUEXF2481DRAFT_1667 [Aureobasidium subglaciale EXF-2481]KEQ98835.1 hypothetical protein AUEXF2481DRAFT_1667 [Aureobasidium subglaciale EXF-2481]
MAEMQSSTDTTTVFQRLDGYDWDHDNEFQAALSSILRSASTPEQTAHLTVRARCYYYTRKFRTPVNFEAYQQWLQSQNDSDPEPQPAASSEVAHPPSMGEAPPPASFAEICALIAEGKPIPGIKDIPDTVLEGQGTQAQAPRRKKPWEKDAPAAPTPCWATSN